MAGTGDTDNASFNLNGASLRASDVFDFETQSSYSVRVQTDDGNGGTYQVAFTVTIINENESIVVSSPLADQSLNEGFGSFDLELSAVFTDQDGDALIYSVMSSQESFVTAAIAGSTLTLSEVGGFGTSTITITADDGSGVTTSDEFEVTVNEVFSTETDITAFSLAEQTGPATIDANNHTIEIEVVSGIGITSLTPSITVSNGASISPSGSQDFTNVVTYTVTAEDGSTIQDWMVTVTIEEVALGLEDQLQIDVFPNPASDFVQIQAEQNMSIRVINLEGKEVIGTQKGSDVKISLGQLSQGSYLLMIQADQELVTRRIIKIN